jgi:hypothetical protein
VKECSAQQEFFFHAGRVVPDRDVGRVLELDEPEALDDTRPGGGVEVGEDLQVAAAGELVEVVVAVRDVAEEWLDLLPLADDVEPRDVGGAAVRPPLANNSPRYRSRSSPSTARYDPYCTTRPESRIITSEGGMNADGTTVGAGVRGVWDRGRIERN